MSVRMFEHHLTVINLTKSPKPYEVTIHSIYANTIWAVWAYEQMNKGLIKVIGHKSAFAEEPQEPLEESTPSVPLAEEPSAPLACPEEQEDSFTTLLDDVVDWVADGEHLKLHVFSEYDSARCEVTMSYHIDSCVSYDLTLVANSLEAALKMARVMSMQGHLSHAVRRIQLLTAMRKSCENRVGGR